MTSGHDDDRWTMGDDSSGWEDSGDHGGGEDPPPLPNIFKRAIMTLFSPGELFAVLRPQPAVVGIMFLSALVATVAMAIVPVEAFPVPEAPATEEGGEGAAFIPPGLVKIMALGSAFVGSLAMPLIFTAISWVAFRAIRRDEATFKQQLSINAHALFISAVGAVLTLPAWFSSLDITNTFTLASLAPFLADGFFHDLLSSMDLFHAWVLAVASLGLSSLDPRRSWLSTAAVLAGIWIAIAAASVVISAGLSRRVDELSAGVLLPFPAFGV